MIKKINAAQADPNTGFSANTAGNAGRFIKKDGSPNVEKRGISLFERYSIYHVMITISRWKFALAILSFFICINLVFALIYFLVGTDQLGGVSASTKFGHFAEAFFFSAQTFTTVGYGRISPSGTLTSSIAAIEALTGLLSFAVVTGLFYGRFSRPRAYIKFSENMVIAPYNDITALMFRMAPYKNNQLTEAEVKINAAMGIEENGKPANKFYSLDLEISKINSLNLSWTVVHPIDEKSPLYNFTLEDLNTARLEVLVFVKAFDEIFSNTVIARTSYTADEIIPGARFKIMFEPDPSGKVTFLHLDRLNDIEIVKL
jgi:inward rectifier potassium channel